MSRLAASVAVIAAAIGLSATGVQSSVPPPDQSTTTAALAPATTAEAASATTAPPTASTLPVAERGSAGAVDITKDEDEAWSVRRIATTVGIVVVVLAVAGYVYGRVRSHRPPASSALATTSD